jgi:hypothetical protein
MIHKLHINISYFNNFFKEILTLQSLNNCCNRESGGLGGVSQVEKSRASLDLNPALVVWVQWQL